MKKIPRLFTPDPNDLAHCIPNEYHPDAQWVADGEGIATRKWDGTAVLIKDGKLYARYDAKNGKQPPVGAIPCTDAPDPETMHWPHWVEVTADTKQYKWHWIAFTQLKQEAFEAGCYSFYAAYNGTYELCGPHFQTNPEYKMCDVFIPHGKALLQDCPVGYAALIEYLKPLDIEGIVWHHISGDGRMVKLTKGHLGLERKPNV